MVAGVVAQSRERLLHVEAFSFGHHALGLFDDDAAVESVLELLVDDLGLERGPVLEDGDGGDIGQGLGGFDIGRCISPGSTWNRLRAPMTVPRQAQGQRLDGAETGRQRLGGEQGPATGHHGQVLVHHRPAAAVAVQAGPSLDCSSNSSRTRMASLEEAITRSSPSGPANMRPAAPTSSTLDAAVSQQGQQLDHVEVRYERVCQLHQRPGEQCFSGHRTSSHGTGHVGPPGPGKPAHTYVTAVAALALASGSRARPASRPGAFAAAIGAEDRASCPLRLWLPL